MDQIQENARSDVSIVLAANKIDLTDKREVLQEEGQQLAK